MQTCINLYKGLILLFQRECLPALRSTCINLYKGLILDLPRVIAQKSNLALTSYKGLIHLEKILSKSNISNLH